MLGNHMVPVNMTLTHLTNDNMAQMILFYKSDYYDG